NNQYGIFRFVKYDCLDTGQFVFYSFHVIKKVAKILIQDLLTVIFNPSGFHAGTLPSFLPSRNKVVPVESAPINSQRPTSRKPPGAMPRRPLRALDHIKNEHGPA